MWTVLAAVAGIAAVLAGLYGVLVYWFFVVRGEHLR
jgi:hypothetical protein